MLFSINCAVKEDHSLIYPEPHPLRSERHNKKQLILALYIYRTGYCSRDNVCNMYGWAQLFSYKSYIYFLRLDVNTGA